MKRNPIIFLVLVLVLALSITSCELLDEMEYGDGTDIDNENQITDGDQSDEKEEEKLPDGDENKEEHVHDYRSGIHEQDPSCFEDGFIKRICSCGEYTTEILPAYGKHTECVVKGYPPTCTEVGLTDTRYCTVCNEIFEEEKLIDPTGHDYVNASYDNNDYHKYECSVCNIYDLVEHSYDENNRCTACDHTLRASENIIYEISQDGRTAKVTGYIGDEKHIVISDTYEGLPVTEIGDGAFYHATLLKYVKIPDSVEKIGDSAFYSCLGITSITLPANLKYIGDWAFNVCTITTVELPVGVTHIGDFAFYNCENIESVSIPASTLYIGQLAFGQCDSLTSITVDQNNDFYKSIDGNLYTKDGKGLIQYATGKTDESFIIPDHVTTVHLDAFTSCQLKSVTISDSVVLVETSAFSYCPNLTYITIGRGLTELGKAAFAANERLLSITVDEDNEYFMSLDGNLYTKDGKTLLQYAIGKTDTTFVIADTVEAVYNYSFAESNYLTKIVVNNNVTEIGNYAFMRCESLTSLILSNRVSPIWCDMVQGCESLTDIYYYGSEEEWNMAEKYNINCIPENVTIHFNYNP